mgnify:CR=1 FL=1
MGIRTEGVVIWEVSFVDTFGVAVDLRVTNTCGAGRLANRQGDNPSG